jgi:hypothetical protein
MSLVINHQQYDVLASLRKQVTAAVIANNPEETNRTVGMVQGYLIGLHTAGEIDAGDVRSLEAETLAGMDFLLNARRAGYAH